MNNGDPASAYDLLPVFRAPRGPILFKPTGVTPKVNRFLEMAKGVALTSKCKFQHGAIVVKHGHVLGASPNVQKNDPKYVEFEHSQVHAEIRAMQKAGWPTKATVYVARVNGNGESRLSKPCANCAAVLASYRCRAVWSEDQ